MKKLDTFTQAYVECALWSSTDILDDEDTPLDDFCDISDISEETMNQMIADCLEFQSAYYDDISDDLEHAGHDFWLTRNGHGAGFWDGDWPDEIGEKLTVASKKFGEMTLYLGDDDKIYDM